MKTKLLIKSAITAFILTVLYSVIPFQAVCAEIPDNVFRFHIIANSDSKADQSLKLKVRDRVLDSTKALFESAKTKSEAENIVKANLSAIEKTAQNEVYNNGCRYTVSAEVVNMHFDTRYYDNYTLPAGMYDALRITIGSGKGHNWWCVMFPSICISSADEGKEKAKSVFNDDEYHLVAEEKTEYKFFVVELFEKIFVH